MFAAFVRTRLDRVWLTRYDPPDVNMTKHEIWAMCPIYPRL
jgi:hypothetical protein